MKTIEQMTLRTPNPEDWRSVTQTAAEIGIAPSTLWELIRKGKIRAYKIGKLTVMWADDVAAYAEAYRRVKA